MIHKHNNPEVTLMFVTCQFDSGQPLFCSKACGMNFVKTQGRPPFKKRQGCLSYLFRGFWPSIGHYASRASVVVLAFTGARRPLLLKSSILATNKSLRIFNITKMATKRSQHAMLSGQYRVFKNAVLETFRVLRLKGPKQQL